MKKGLRTSVVVIAGHLGCLSPAFSQAPPQGGSVLKELERTEPAPKPPAARQDLRIPEDAAGPGDAGPRIMVRGFRITGAKLIPAEELQREIAAYVGTEQSLADLRKIALRLSELYRKRGYFARALVPQQRVSGGILEIAIIESTLAAVDVEVLPGTRFSAEDTRQFITAQQKLGEPLRPDAARWGMNNLNDLPGVSALGVLHPGDAQGEVKLAVRVESTPLLTGGIFADNFGLRATGQARVIGQAQLNSPLKFGDQLTLLGVATERSDFERLGYSFPLGYSGLRAGLAAARLGYRLGGTFNGNNGSAKIFGATLAQPLLRTPTSNFFGGLALEYKRFINDLAGDINLNNKSLKTAQLQFRGDFSDGALGTAAHNAFSVALVHGRLDLARNADSLRQDQSGAQTQGNFSKVPWNAQRVQTFANGWEIAASALGQFALENLDSYEKFSLGGPTGVRAYPAGEALGDDGVLASLELRRIFNPEVQASAFVDAGHIKQWHNLTPGLLQGGGNRANSYSLYGMGVGLQYGRSGDWMIRGSVAWKLGSNPGRDANGKDSDGGDSKVRAWVQVAKFF